MAEDNRGWHGDSEGHTEAAKGNGRSEGFFEKVKSEFNDSNSGTEGQGWHGDSEGHAKAAEKGQRNDN